jgi:putative Holliday junction resolvase
VPKAIRAVLDIVSEHEVERIVVGLPYQMSGDTGGQAEKVTEFVELLQQHTDIPIELRDERLSTVSARQLLRQGRGKRGRGKVRYDAAAAAVILQAFLDEGR